MSKKNGIAKYAYCKAHKKRRFKDKKSADRSIHCFSNQITSGERDTNRKIPVRSYFCPHCNGYHITSKPGPEF